MIDHSQALSAQKELFNVVNSSGCDAVVSIGIGKEENGDHKVVLCLFNDHWQAWPKEINGVKIETKICNPVKAL